MSAYMELKNCCNIHFIQAIRFQEVTKIRNRDSRGRPALVTRTLQDVYKSEDARRIGRSPTTGSASVKCEAPCFPTVNRTLREPVECFRHDGNGMKSDLDDDTTLRQLRDRFRTKKRKSTHGRKNTNKVSVDENSLEDHSDLDEPLVNWKSKKPKNSKAKRKCISRNVASSSITSFAVKSEKNTFSENYLQVFGELAPVVSVKIKVHEAGELGDRRKTSLDDSSLDHNEEPSLGDASNRSQTLDQHDYTEQHIVCVTNEISYSHLEDIEVHDAGESGDRSKTSLDDDSCLDHSEEPSFGDASNRSQTMDEHDHTEKHIVCVTNEITYSHLEDIEPMSMLVPWHGMYVKLETQELDCHECQNLHPLAIDYGKETFDDQDPDFTSHMSKQNNSSDVLVPVITIDSPHEQDNSLSSRDQDYVSSQDSTISLKIDENLVSMEDTTADKEQPSFCTLDGIKSNSLNNGSSQMEDSVSPIIGVETQSCVKDQRFECADTLSSQEPCPHPEKLLSKRKAISPTSRERLYFAMNSEEQCNDVDQYIVLKCKEELFEKQTRNKASFFRSDIPSAKVIINHGPRVHFNHRNSPQNGIKRSQNAKGNFEGVRPRTLSQLTTACNSIEGCSENAIKFSQRQMHDMENLALKLMKELNSMKEVVEQKLLFTAYRNVSLKNDADEVKSAICNATKVEEVARKWLNIMSRDCNRFCKIMKMTPQSGVESKDTVLNSKKKIKFADEVGGELCHVKIFKVGESSSFSDEVKKDLHST